MKTQGKLIYVLIGIFGLTLYVTIPNIEPIHAVTISGGLAFLTFFVKRREPARSDDSGINPFLKKKFNSYKKRKDADKGIKLKGNEKKMIIFFILNKVETSETLDMKEISDEFNIPRDDLDDLVKFLDTHKVVNVLYLPMTDYPILRKADNDMADRYKKRIFNDLAKASVQKNPNFANFSKEVSEYLDSIRRLVPKK